MKRNSTKRALLMSVLSLLLCVSMLVGTTFAWFTDSVTSANNIIKSGNLDVEMYWADGTKAVPTEDAGWTDASEGAIFNYDLWEPGYTEVRHIKIANEGSLALKYQVSIVANGEVSDLSDVIDVYYIDPAVQVANRTDLTDANKLGTLTQVLAGMATSANGALSAGESDTITIALKMQESAGNEYQNKSIGTDFSVVLLATQMTEEIDSFGPEYDELAILSGSVNDSAPAPGGSKLYTVRSVNNGNVIATMEIHSDSVADTDKPISIEIIPIDRDEDVHVTTNQNAATFDITVSNLNEDNQVPISVELYAGKNLSGVKVYHKNSEIAGVTYSSDTGFAAFEITSFSPFTIVYDKPIAMIGDTAFKSIYDAFAAAEDGNVVELRQGYNTTDTPLTETIVVDKEITLNHNGMYLVSAAPATFTVVEGGKLTVTEGSFTIKNTSTNGAAVLVDGGEFVMEGGSFDAHTAVRTTEGKSSTVTLTAGWSNRVTVSFDLKGNDTLNVTGGSIYSSAEAVKTVAGNHINFNMSGGLLSSRTSQYSAAVNLQGTATVNMTGGKIENTYSSGYNGSSAIQANVAPTTINLSGTAALSSNGVAVMLGSHWSEPAVHEEKIALNMSGDASISATSQMGFGIRYAQDCCDVNISGNAKVNATFQAIQFNTNNYVYTNSTLVVSENATITSTAGRIGGGYGIAANGHVTITGGTISGSTAGVASFQEGAVVIVDNSESGTPITINKVDIADGVTYTIAGNPSIG